jgi:hypothetical protein
MNTKFTSLRATKVYLKDKKFKFTEQFPFKGEQSYLYKYKGNTAYVSSTWGYLNKDTMDCGSVWTVTTFKGEA